MTPHWVGMVGTALVMAAFVPQISLLLKSKKVGALNLNSTVLNMMATLSLFAYAIVRDNTIFIVTLGFQLAAAIVILVLNIRYQDKTS